jgi:hypothetical protein
MFFCLDAKEPKNQGEIKLAHTPQHTLLSLAQTVISPEEIRKIFTGLSLLSLVMRDDGIPFQSPTLRPGDCFVAALPAMTGYGTTVILSIAKDLVSGDEEWIPAYAGMTVVLLAQLVVIPAQAGISSPLALSFRVPIHRDDGIPLQSRTPGPGDCFVAALLAMTGAARRSS